MALKKEHRRIFFILQCASLLYKCSAISLQPCVNGQFDIYETNPNNNITCSSSQRGAVVEWILETNSVYVRGICNFSSGSCSSTEPEIFIRALVTPENVFSMFIHFPDTDSSMYEGGIIKCSETNGLRSQATCALNVIYPPVEPSCSLNFTTDNVPWNLSGNCSTSKMYSERGQYYCQLYEVRENVSEVAKVPMTTTPIDERYVSGSCQFIFQSLSTDNSSYRVIMTPGDVTIPGEWIIRKPSSSLTHSCPESIKKGSTLNCTCSSVDMGSPAGSLQWIYTNTEQLVKHNVGPDDDGTQFTCQLSWNGIVVKSLTYILQLYYYSEDLDDARSKGIGAGIAIGTAVCVALAAILVGIFLLWRRGWRLPAFSAFACDCNKIRSKLPARQGKKQDATRVNMYDIVQKSEPEKYEAFVQSTVEPGLRSRSDPDGGVLAPTPKATAHRKEVLKTPISGQWKEVPTTIGSAQKKYVSSECKTQRKDSLPRGHEERKASIPNVNDHRKESRSVGRNENKEAKSRGSDQKKESRLQGNEVRKDSRSHGSDQRKGSRPYVLEQRQEPQIPEPEQTYDCTNKDDVGENYEPFCHNSPGLDDEPDEIYQNEDQTT